MQKKIFTTERKNSKTFRSLVLGVSLLFAGAMCAQNQNQVVVPPPIEIISSYEYAYTGTITNGSQTALYVYVPKYANYSMYSNIVDSVVAPEYAAIMPDAEHLSTPMNGFLIYATAEDTVTLDAEANAAVFDSIMNLGKWSDITNAAAFFYPSATPVGTPQSSVSTRKILTGESWETTQEFAYVDGKLTSITTYQQTLYYKEFTITNQSITVSDTTTGIDLVGAQHTTTLRAWVTNGTLHISGLAAGEAWSVYNATGMSLPPAPSKGGGVATMPLPAHGIYIVKQGNNAVKAVY